MKPAESDSSDNKFRPLGPVVRADEAEKWFSAAAYLDEARRQGDQITARARLALEEHRVRGFEAGRLEGVEQAARLIADTKAAVDDFVARMHDELIALIVEIVREILGSFEPDDFAARAVARALKDMRAGTTLMLMTAPEEAEAIRA